MPRAWGLAEDVLRDVARLLQPGGGGGMRRAECAARARQATGDRRQAQVLIYVGGRWQVVKLRPNAFHQQN